MAFIVNQYSYTLSNTIKSLKIHGSLAIGWPLAGLHKALITSLRHSVPGPVFTPHIAFTILLTQLQ